jgi:hypothetical protein
MENVDFTVIVTVRFTTLEATRAGGDAMLVCRVRSASPPENRSPSAIGVD